MKRTTRWLSLLLSILLVVGFVRWIWPVSRDTVYQVYRSYGKARVISGLDGYDMQESERFQVYYQQEDEDIAPLILETAEDVYDRVVESIGYRPKGLVPLIIYPDRATFREAFGWGAEESALGVYHAGTIRLLSPHVWIKNRTPAEQAKTFRKLGPVSHELSHYVLDYLTQGNYPRWFTEGLAQRIEYQITGFLWLEEESTLRQRLYTLRELESGFDRLPNQALAYRQSYLLVDYMAETYGEEMLTQLIERLAAGDEFATAIHKVTGASLQSIRDDWAQWVESNLDELDLDS